VFDFDISTDLSIPLLFMQGCAAASADLR